MMKLTINGTIFTVPQEKLKDIPYFASRMSGRWNAEPEINDPNLDVPSLLIYLFHQDVNDTLQKQRQLVDYLGAPADKIQGLVLPLDTLLAYIEKKDFRNLQMLQHYELNLDNPLPKSGLLDRILDLIIEDESMMTNLNNRVDDYQDKLRPILIEWFSILAKESHRLQICCASSKESRFGRILKDNTLHQKMIENFSGERLCSCLKNSFTKEFISTGSSLNDVEEIVNFIDFPFLISRIWNLDCYHSALKNLLTVYHEFDPVESSHFMHQWVIKNYHPTSQYSRIAELIFSLEYKVSNKILDYLLKQIIETPKEMVNPEQLLDQILQRGIVLSAPHIILAIKSGSPMIYFLLSRGAPFEMKFLIGRKEIFERRIRHNCLYFFDKLYEGISKFTKLIKEYSKWLEELIISSNTGYGLWKASTDICLTYFKKWGISLTQKNHEGSNLLNLMAESIQKGRARKNYPHKYPKISLNGIKIMEALIKEGVDKNNRNSDGLVPIYYFLHHPRNCPKIEEINILKFFDVLFDHGVKLDLEGNNPLHLIAKWYDPDPKLIEYFRYRYPELFSERNNEGCCPHTTYSTSRRKKKEGLFDVDSSLIERVKMCRKYNIKVLELYSREELRDELLTRKVDEKTIKKLKSKQSLHDHLLKICQ